MMKFKTRFEIYSAYVLVYMLLLMYNALTHHDQGDADISCQILTVLALYLISFWTLLVHVIFVTESTFEMFEWLTDSKTRVSSNLAKGRIDGYNPRGCEWSLLFTHI